VKKIVVTMLLLHCFTHSFGQNADITSMVDSLRYLKADTLDCSANLYWRIVAKGEKAIPSLIDKLADTTPTNVSQKCKATKLNVGEVAYFTLEQIAFFPTFEITHIQFDLVDINGCWNFFDYFFDNANKTHYQSLVRQWYDKNKIKFKPSKISRKNQTKCQKLFGIDTYLRWNE
jgi:hypothetical protein